MILNLKFPNVPLTAGCALSMVPVLLIVFLYVPQEALGCLRMFGFLVMAFIVFIAVCFSTELALIKDTSAADVFRGYLPSAALVERRALYHACSIIGATLVPHALYVGSGIVQARLRNFDVQSGLLPADRAPSPAGNDRSRHPKTYQPSVAAIRHCFAYSVAELVVCLFLFTLFVSSAVLVVSAASLYGRDPFIQVDGGTGPTDRNVIEQPTSLIGIYRFLHICLSPFAGDIFRLALILSGMLAGIVCTMAGQMLSEGALRWRVRLWMRFVATRGFTILPSIVIVIAAAADEKWVVEALKWSSVVQGVVLPFVAAPLVYFTSVEKCEWCLSCFVCLA
ncbi:NRAMP family [Schizothecium vesticola]|uniref:NRAMP family n=1 Tax=Schizothecium vesticola TaxID=314040 RepID=A0AA40EPK2_9PEZI|nr:NRAMP family [Schizothecium vesticola]